MNVNYYIYPLSPLLRTLDEIFLLSMIHFFMRLIYSNLIN